MATLKVELDLTEDELTDLRVAIHGFTGWMQAIDRHPLVRPAEALQFHNLYRSLGIVLYQLRTNVTVAHDGGPVGTARYAIR